MRARAIVAVTATLLLASCALEGADEGVATYEKSGSGGNDALLTGTLTVTDGCLYVVDEFGTSWMPLFPRGEARLRDGELTFGRRSTLVGDVAELGGGETVRATIPSDWHVPEACSTEHMWIVSS